MFHCTGDTRTPCTQRLGNQQCLDICTSNPLCLTVVPWRLTCWWFRLHLEFFRWQHDTGGGASSRWSSGCLNNCCLGTVRPCEKPSQRETVEHTIFMDSCVEIWFKKQWHPTGRFWEAMGLRFHWYSREGHGPWRMLVFKRESNLCMYLGRSTTSCCQTIMRTV